MTLCQGVLDKLLAVSREHAESQAETDRLKRQRDRLVLEATVAGATRADLAAGLNITRARVQQIVERARRTPRNLAEPGGQR